MALTRYPKMTIEQHEAVAPLTSALYHGLISFGINRYPKNSSASRHHRSSIKLVMALKSRLDDEWCAIADNDEVAKIGFLYYRDDLRDAAARFVSESTKGMAPVDYAEWLRTIAEQVIDRVEGFYPVKVLDAALAVERSLHNFRFDLIDAPLKRGAP